LSRERRWPGLDDTVHVQAQHDREGFELERAPAPAAPSAFVNGISRTTTTIGTRFANDKITFTSGGLSAASNLFHVF
jgi:hypothetical protein